MPNPLRTTTGQNQRTLKPEGPIKAFSRALPASSPSPARGAGTVDGRTLLIKEMLSGTSSLLALTQVEPWHTRFWLWIQLYPGQFMGTQS